MSKKLIAIASAAALGLSALVGIAPATALPVVTADTGTSFLKVTGITGATTGAGGIGTAASAFVHRVADSGTVAANLITFNVSHTAKRTAATVTTTSGIKLLDAPADADNKYTTLSGKDSLSLTTTDSGTLVFYGFTTSTATGIVTLTIGADITQVYIKGTAGDAYAIASVTPPTTVAPEGKGTYVVSVVDAFGNAVEDGTLTSAAIGGGEGTAIVSEETTAGEPNEVVYSGTTKRWAAILTAGKSAGQIAVSITLGGTATDDQVAAFGTPVRTYFHIVSTSSLAAQITELTKQVAALQAKVDRKVTKKRYNTLARKWNRAFPSQKVTLKK